jgi:transcriptional regulator with XRE-family HTH domain
MAIKVKNWRHLTAAHVRAFRRRAGLSWTEFARELGYSRSYIAHIERGVFPITRKFSQRFMEMVRERTREELQSKAIISRYRLPKQLEIIARPRKCPGCGEWFIWSNERRRYCDDDCRARARARKRRGERR